MTQISRCRENKHISKFSVDSEVCFVCELCMFTVSYSCIGHYVGNYYVDVRNRQLGRLFRQTNKFARNIFHTKFVYPKASADVNISIFFGEKWGDEALDHKMDL